MCGWVALPSTENPGLLILHPLPSSRAPLLGSEALSQLLHPLLVVAHHHSALVKPFLLPPPCNSWPQFLILALKALTRIKCEAVESCSHLSN